MRVHWHVCVLAFLFIFTQTRTFASLMTLDSLQTNAPCTPTRTHIQTAHTPYTYAQANAYFTHAHNTSTRTQEKNTHAPLLLLWRLDSL